MDSNQCQDCTNIDGRDASCQSSYFILALFALLMSLLVKYLHSHPPYLLCNLCSLAALFCSAQRHCQGHSTPSAPSAP